MAQEAKELNLYQKLEKIRALAEVVQKDSNGYNYKYASITSILASVKAGMNKYHVSLIPEMVPLSQEVIVDEWTETKTTKNGSTYEKENREYRFSSRMVYRWINNDKPDEFICVPWYVVGNQSDPSQAMGSALTYAERYFMMQFFQIATPEDDPDNWRSRKKEAEEEEGKEIAQSIIAVVDKAVREHLEKFPDDRDEVTKIIKKFARDGKKPSPNYFNIKNPETAKDLMEALKQKFEETKNKAAQPEEAEAKKTKTTKK